uniref:P21-activated protein kinase-interacting protein 1-like protein n=2 Tax=Auxenochlorella protothecoides TaxID=3075 RepID=A0A1D2A8Y5_AUXPR
MLFAAGSYERFLFGFEWDQEQATSSLTKSFTHPAHKGAIRSIAAAGPFLACGGSEDTIHIYNLRTNKDLGFLMAPGEGAVTAAVFHTPTGRSTPTHLLTGSADGSLSIWGVGGEWTCLKTFKAHTKEVTGVAVHPSGRVALSISRDGTLRIWDLVKGRSTFATKLPQAAEAITFSPSGDVYALLAGAVLSMHSVAAESSTALATLSHERRVLCHAFHGEDVLLTGCDDGSLHAWSIPDEAEILTIPEAHGSRIRGLAVAPQSSASDASSSIQASKSPSTAHALPRLVGTASSDGTLRLWNLEDIRAGAGGAAPQPLAEVDTRARLTCLTAMLSPTELAAQHAAEREAMKAAAALRKAKKRRTEPEAGEAGEGTRATKATKARKTKEAEELRGGAEAPAPQHDRTSKGNKEEGKSAGPRKGPRAGSESEAAARPDRRPGQAPRPVLPARPGVVDFVSDADLLAQRSKRQSMQARVARGRKAAHRPIGPAAP